MLDWKRYVSFEVRRQLPPDFRPFEGVPVRLRVKYVYTPPKSWPKRDVRALAAGCRFWKITKPDLSDNLNKGLVDALTGVLWRDDALVAYISAVKVYGTGAERTVLVVEPLPQGDWGGEEPVAWRNDSTQGEKKALPDADALPLFAGDADSRLGEAPNGAFSPPDGKFPHGAVPRASRAVSGVVAPVSGFPVLRDPDTVPPLMPVPGYR